MNNNDDLVRRLRESPLTDVRLLVAAIEARDQRIATLEGEVERLRDANGVDIYIADAEAAERRAEAAEKELAQLKETK